MMKKIFLLFFALFLIIPTFVSAATIFMVNDSTIYDVKFLPTNIKIEWISFEMEIPITKVASIEFNKLQGGIITFKDGTVLKNIKYLQEIVPIESKEFGKFEIPSELIKLLLLKEGNR